MSDTPYTFEGQSVRVVNNNGTNWIPSMIDGWHPGMEGKQAFPPLLNSYDSQFFTALKQQTPEEVQEMAWSNPEAADIAREILTDAKREGLREKITEAVADYRKMLEGAHCGSVFSFMKESDDGKHYWYAAIKNGDKWYTTANPRILNSDDEFITWLVGLGAHESKASELTVGAAHEALALGPIEATAVEP